MNFNTTINKSTTTSIFSFQTLSVADLRDPKISALIASIGYIIPSLNKPFFTYADIIAL